MSYCAEYVTYSSDLDEQELLRLRAVAIKNVKSVHPALISVPVLGKRTDGTYFDVWIYENEEAAQRANSDAHQMADFMNFFAAVKDVSIEYTCFPESAIDPLA